jgi:hypothetical protein
MSCNGCSNNEPDAPNMEKRSSLFMFMRAAGAAAGSPARQL